MNDLVITLCNTTDHDKTIELVFDLYPTEIAERWKQQLLIAQSKNYSINDPQRFYGLKNKLDDINYALTRINKNIDIINQYQNIVDRKINAIDDQDTLNYLHHIFEEYHGLLDQQNTDFWNNASQQVRESLADLNICVHRIESLQRRNDPRFVVTYFQLPKIEKLKIEDYTYLTDYYSFGGLYLNYVEIGKTLEDLMKDNDEYIHDDAFKPWSYFSADFRVTLKDSNIIESRINRQNCLDYFRRNREFFESRGYVEYDPRLKPGFIQIGQMKCCNQEETIKLIQQHQFVKSVLIS